MPSHEFDSWDQGPLLRRDFANSVNGSFDLQVLIDFVDAFGAQIILPRLVERGIKLRQLTVVSACTEFQRYLTPSSARATLGGAGGAQNAMPARARVTSMYKEFRTFILEYFETEVVVRVNPQGFVRAWSVVPI